MILTISGTEYDVVGYETYLDDYSKAAKPEFRNDGEQEFTNELEEIIGNTELKDGKSIEIVIPYEKSLDRRYYKFFFSVFTDYLTILGYEGYEVRH